ncbi:hypothetical protein ABIE41_003861 [Bosea sp. OAE506]|uniref:hypothetical protein n=1 Tax=Bosea sp. OAE506 TaxID=2663870 RepID=UPI00178AA8A8
MSLIKSVVLANPEHVVPRPGVPGAILPQNEAFTVSVLDPFFAGLLADGTLIDAPAPEPEKAPAGKARA